MNLNELRASRHDSFSAADKLVKAARESGKDLAGADLEQYQGHIAEMKNLDGLIAKCQQIGSSAQSAHFRVGGETQTANESEWVDPRSGQPIQVLRPDQRMVDLVAPQAHGDPLSLGKYLRGVVTGKWDGAHREM